MPVFSIFRLYIADCENCINYGMDTLLIHSEDKSKNLLILRRRKDL